MTSSIAIKPRTTRAKNLILRGAKGRDARHDNCQHGRGHQGESHNCMRPMPSTRDLITESLDGGMLSLSSATPQTSIVGESRLAYTTRSNGFGLPAHQRRTAQVVGCKPRTPVLPELPQFDEAGRPIVYRSSYDAWYRHVRG